MINIFIKIVMSILLFVIMYLQIYNMIEIAKVNKMIDKLNEGENKNAK